MYKITLTIHAEIEVTEHEKAKMHDVIDVSIMPKITELLNRHGITFVETNRTTELV